jgi:hypothetical protein
MDITNFTDEDLNKLMENIKKNNHDIHYYITKQQREMKNNFHIAKVIIRRYVDKNLENFIESKMDIRLD